MPDVITPVAESSPAAVITPATEAPAPKSEKTWAIPRNAEAREAFLRAPTLAGPEPPKTESQPKADSTPAKTSPDSGSDSGTDKPKQAPRLKTPEDTGARLAELIADLRAAGLTPKELKTFKREAQKEASAERPASETRVPDSKPAEAPKPPEFAKAKPVLKDYDDIEKYADALTDWKMEKSDFDRAYRDTQAKLAADVKAMREKAEERYGPEYEAPLKHAAETIFTKDAGAIPGVIKAMINESDVMADLLYTLGTDRDALTDFVALSKDKPTKAIEKLVLLQQGIREELAKPKSVSRETEGEASATPPRGENGKFVKAAEAQPETPKTPAKKATPAQDYEPPMEAAGLRPAPPDDLQTLTERIMSGKATAKDQRRWIELENAKDIERLRSGRR